MSLPTDESGGGTDRGACRSDTPSPTVRIPFMTRSASGDLADTTLQDLGQNLYVNVRVLGVGGPGRTASPAAGGAGLAATDSSVQDPATESRADDAVEPVEVDTGSWATVLSRGFVERSLARAGVNFTRHDLESAGYPRGSLTYSSSGTTETGYWVPTAMGFPDAANPDGSMVTTAVTALITDDGEPHAMMGVGMNAAFAVPTVGETMTPDNNAFLSVAQMREGTMAHGFAIRNDGIHLGESAANARSRGGWTLQGLRPSTIGRSPSGVQDWRFPVVEVGVGGRTFTAVSMMNDTDIPDMFLETPDGRFDTAGQEVSFSLTGEGATTRWSFTSPGEGGTDAPSSAGGDQRLAPSKLSTSRPNSRGTWTPTAAANVDGSYTNTGVNVLRGYDYLYDADAGVFGLTSGDRDPVPTPIP